MYGEWVWKELALACSGRRDVGMVWLGGRRVSTCGSSYVSSVLCGVANSGTRTQRRGRGTVYCCRRRRLHGPDLVGEESAMMDSLLLFLPPLLLPDSFLLYSFSATSLVLASRNLQFSPPMSHSRDLTHPSIMSDLGTEQVPVGLTVRLFCSDTVLDFCSVLNSRANSQMRPTGHRIGSP